MTGMIDAAKAAELLRLHSNILIITHRRTDGDTCGSSAALCIALRRIGKNAFILGNSETSYRNRVLMEAFLPPEGFKHDFVVTVDVADVGLLSPEAQGLSNDIDLCIDHHASNGRYSKMLYLEDGAAAAGELIVKVCDGLGVELDREIADMVYIAIATDTGCFKYSNTTAQTMRTAARCYDAGADTVSINKKYFDTKSVKRIKLESYIYGSMRFFASKKMALAFITKKVLMEIGATSDDMDGLSSLAIQIEGVELAVTLTENKTGGYRMSVRSIGDVNASDFCANFGGGGHKNAAGAFFKEDDAEKIINRLVEVGKEFV